MKVRTSVFATLILMSEVIGIALFLRGFFPVPIKSSLASKNRLSDLPAEPLSGELEPSPALTFVNINAVICHLQKQQYINDPTRNSRLSPANIHKIVALFTGGSPNTTRLPHPLFKRVVIMLVDALREDFIFGPNGGTFMPYTRHVVEKGSSYSFVAKARPPTVTMPRIKVSWVQWHRPAH